MCACGQVYFGQTGCTIAEQLAENQRYIHLRQGEKSGLEEYCTVSDHVPVFGQTKVLSKQESFWNRVIEEAIFIHLEPNTVNRDSGLKVENSWKPMLRLLMR